MSPRNMPTSTSITMPGPVGQAPQKHGMGQTEPDPVDAKERHRDPADAGSALREGQPEQHRQHGDRHKEYLELVSVERRQQQPGKRDEARRGGRDGLARTCRTARACTRTPSTNRPSANTMPPSITRNRATAIEGTATSTRAPRSERSRFGPAPGRRGRLGGRRRCRLRAWTSRPAHPRRRAWSAGHQPPVIVHRTGDGARRTPPATPRGPRA